MCCTEFFVVTILRRTLPACATNEMPPQFPHSVLSFLSKTFITAARHRCGIFLWCRTNLITRWNSRSNVRSCFSPLVKSSTKSSSGPTAFRVLCQFDPESVCDSSLGEPFDDVESELVNCCVEKGAEEPRPPSEDKL